MTHEPIYSPEPPEAYDLSGLRPWDWVMHDLACWNFAYICLPEIDEFLVGPLAEHHRKRIPELVGSVASFASAEHSRTIPGLRAAMLGDPSKARSALFSLTSFDPPTGFNEGWLVVARDRLEEVCRRLKPVAPAQNKTNNVVQVDFRSRR